MRITQLSYFESVCRLGSVTKASKELHVSQPTISMAIKELEMEFGVNLFNRCHKRLSLTEEGKLFYREVKDLLERLDHLSVEMKKLGLNNRSIRVAMPPIIGAFLFPSIFNSFRLKHPDLQIIIRDCHYTDACQALENGLVDFSVIIANSDEHKHYSSLDLLETKLCLCVNKTSPLANKTMVRLRDLSDEPLILMRYGSFQHTKISTYFHDFGLTPNIVLYSSQLYTIFNNVAEGSASAFLIQEMADLHPACKGIPIYESLSLKIQLLWKDDLTINKRFSLLINHLKEVDFASHFKKIQL